MTKFKLSTDKPKTKLSNEGENKCIYLTRKINIFQLEIVQNNNIIHDRKKTI